MPRPGALNLITDIDGLHVGQAQDDRLKSGATVLLGQEPMTAGVHIMGGAPGTRETDLLAPDKTVQAVDALVLSGGSAFGLDAASGVADSLRAAGRGYDVDGQKVAIVPCAILFDLLNGGDKDWTDNPYKALGVTAFKAADRKFTLGTAGAGTGATTAGLKGGIGSASLVLDSGHTVGALVAVNALGSACVGESSHFWAAPFEIDGEFGGLGAAPHYPAPGAVVTKFDSRANTTIAIVATDADLNKAQCTRMATAAHDGMARALMPSHTPHDGDLVFGVSTNARPLRDPKADTLYVGHAAAVCLSRAIARAVYEARPAPGDLLACWCDRPR